MIKWKMNCSEAVLATFSEECGITEAQYIVIYHIRRYKYEIVR